MKKKPSFKIQVFLGIVALVAFILCFAQVGDFVAGLFGKEGNEKISLGMEINRIAKVIFLTVVGLMLVTSGVASLAFPIVGIPMILVGIVMVVYGMWPLFQKQDRESYPNVIK